MAGFTLGNGIVHSMTQNARKLPARSYDSHLSGGQTIKVLDDTFTYDPNGNVLSLTDVAGVGGDNRTWGTDPGAATLYDGLDRLTRVKSNNQWGLATFSYDPLDNLRTSQLGASALTRGYDANNRLVSLFNGMTTWTIGSDVRGNVTSNAMRSQAYEFDLAHRMNAVTGKESYLYDGHGRRARTLNLQTGTIEYFGYGKDGRLLQDWSNRRQVRNGYIYLGNTLVGLYEVNLLNGVVSNRYKHTDALGSPVVTTDAARNVLNRMGYTPYGAPTLPMDGVGYTGHFIDVGTQLTYMQQRYYDPGIGRFLSVDPVPTNPNNGANFSSYWYANNNPYRFTDPDGRMSSEEAKFKREKAQERRSAYEQRQRVRNSDMIFTRTPPVSESAQQSARQGAAVRVTEQVAKDEGFAAEYAQVMSGGEVTYDPKLAQSEAPFGTDDITFGRSAFAEGLDTLKSVAYHELWHEKQKMHGATDVSRMEWDANAAQLLYIQKSGLSVSESYIEYLEANSRSDPTLTGGQK